LRHIYSKPWFFGLFILFLLFLLLIGVRLDNPTVAAVIAAIFVILLGLI